MCAGEDAKEPHAIHLRVTGVSTLGGTSPLGKCVQDCNTKGGGKRGSRDSEEEAALQFDGDPVWEGACNQEHVLVEKWLSS